MTIFSSHAVTEFERLAGQPLHVPVGATDDTAPRRPARLQLVRQRAAGTKRSAAEFMQ